MSTGPEVDEMYSANCGGPLEGHDGIDRYADNYQAGREPETEAERGWHEHWAEHGGPGTGPPSTYENLMGLPEADYEPEL